MSNPLADGAVGIEHDNVVVNDVRLHVVTAGPADGEVVVLLHGFPEFWYSWRYQIPALVEAGYRVVAPDLRGYNRSEKPSDVDSYTIDELVGDVVGLVEAYGDGSAHVVGHDWGGTVAWAVGIERPEVVDRLAVLNAPHPARLTDALDLEQLRRSWYVFFFQVPWLPERLMTLGGSWAVGQAFEQQPTSPDAFDEADIRRYREAFRRPGAARGAINFYRAYLRGAGPSVVADVLPGAGRAADRPGEAEVSVPTLVLWGEQDVALGVDLSEGLEAYVPDLQVRRYPEASHWVQCDVPERVSEDLLAFLD